MIMKKLPIPWCVKIKCSKTVRSKFPIRECFGAVAAEAFDIGSSKAKRDCCACALKPHEDGGQHYHVSIRVSCTKRWHGIGNQIYTKHKIAVNVFLRVW